MQKLRSDRFDVDVVDEVVFSWRQGCRGHPDVPVGFAMLVRAGRGERGAIVDASGCLGLWARAASEADVTVVEASATALDALRHDASGDGAHLPERSGALTIEAGLPWDLAAGTIERILLAPPADRGSARVVAEIDAASSALDSNGELILLLDKRLGAKRYEREASRRFEAGGVVAREGGLRLSRWRSPHPEAGHDAVDPWLTFDVDGLSTMALAGVHAAGKLDPGTRVLLDVLAADGSIGPGSRVLDVGCGWGPIARFAARSGARVVAVDDDLAAVRSCRVNVPDAEVVHLDATRPASTSGLPSATGLFDRVLVNPPFHVGRSVRTGLGRTLLLRARERLADDGELWWVENRALRYAREAGLGDADEVRDEAGFRVMRARGRSAP